MSLDDWDTTLQQHTHFELVSFIYPLIYINKYILPSVLKCAKHTSNCAKHRPVRTSQLHSVPNFQVNTFVYEYFQILAASLKSSCIE